MIRLFVGLDFPFSIRSRLARLCSGLPGARWVNEDSFHLTMRFIGLVDEARADDIDRTLGNLDEPSFDLALDGMGTFGRGRAPHTLWIGVSSNPALKTLQKKIDSALVRLGIPPEGRQFTPHVTLARFGNGNRRSNGERLNPERLHAFFAGNNLFMAGPIRVCSFVLFSSHPGGYYREEARYPLRTEPDAVSGIWRESDNDNPANGRA